MLSSSDKKELHSINEQLLPSGAQIGVCIENTLDGADLEERANTIFRAWKLGNAQKNNGVLLYVALRDRKIRIEVGYGLESQLTDSFCGRVIRQVIAPAFKKEKYDEGILAGVQSLVVRFQGTYGLDLKLNRAPGVLGGEEVKDPDEEEGGWFYLILGALIFGLLFIGLIRWIYRFIRTILSFFGICSPPPRNSSGGGDSSGHSSGGFFSGGGGGFSGGGGSSGGGGASGGW